MEAWKAKAKDIFMSCNGDSDVSRNRLASILRSYFVESDLKPEEVDRWTKDMTEIETVTVYPPKISASNSAYVDWIYIADLLLLPCASPDTRSEEEDQKREDEYQNSLNSYRIRAIVFGAYELMQSSNADDKEVLDQVREAHPKAALANIKEARRLAKMDTRLTRPIEPPASKPMPVYKSLYL